MKVQHITLITNNSATRDTKDILPVTRNLLANLKIGFPLKSVVIPFPETPDTKNWHVRVSVINGGAAFDIMKGPDKSNIAITNYACFHKSAKAEVLEGISHLAKMMPFPIEVPKPNRNQFLVSMPINPFILSPKEMSIAGEVELYIWNELYVAWLELQG